MTREAKSTIMWRGKVAGYPMRYFFVLVFIFALSAFSVYAQVVLNIFSADSQGLEQNEFIVSDAVYVQVQCSETEDQAVMIYVTLEQSVWNDADPLSDVRGGPTPAQADGTGTIPLTLLWSPPLTVGTYDIVVDTNGNGLHDSFENCIDDFSPVGFSVITSLPQGGSGNVNRGAQDPGDHEWVVGPGSPYNAMLQVTIVVDATEAINLSSFTLKGQGTGDETTLANVLVVEDLNNSGTYESGTDTLWGLRRYSADNGNLTITTSRSFSAGSSRTVLIVYEMGQGFSNGDTFQFTLQNITATGAASGSLVTLANLPVSSGIKTVKVPAASEEGEQSVPIEEEAPDDEMQPVEESVEESVTEEATEEESAEETTAAAKEEEFVSPEEEPIRVGEPREVIPEVEVASSGGLVSVLIAIIVALLGVVGYMSISSRRRPGESDSR